jgi:glutathione S-transferase
MRLYHTPASPFVRKVMVTIHELGIGDKVEVIPTKWPHSWATQTVAYAPDFLAATPVARIPALVTDDGLRLTDSSVICEYLDAEYGANRLIPAEGAERWRVLAVAAVANAIIEAHVARRAELLRDGAERSQDLIAKMVARQMRCYRDLDEAVVQFGAAPDFAQICAGCACGYAEWRFPEDGWRAEAPRLAAWYDEFARRSSMQATRPAETPTR